MSKSKLANELRKVSKELAIAEKKIGAVRERINKILEPTKTRRAKPKDEKPAAGRERLFPGESKPPSMRGFMNQ